MAGLLTGALLLGACIDLSQDLTGSVPPDVGTEVPDLDAVDAGAPIPLHLELDERMREQLYADPTSDERRPARLRAGDGPASDAEVRFRGNSSRWHPAPSFNVRTAGVVPELGTDRLNLNAMWTDPSQLRERLVWEAFAHLGRPASATRYVELYLDEVFEGLYLQVQRVDEAFLAEHGLEATTATLVRDRTRQVDGAASAFAGDLPADDTELEDWVAQRFEHRGEPDHAALAELVRWVHDTPAGEAFATGFEARFDVEVFVDWLALTVLSADLDSFADDYWLHRDHADPDGRWTVLPWDHDLSFGSHYLAGVGTTNHLFRYGFLVEANTVRNPLVHRFLTTPSLRARFDGRLAELLDRDLPVAWFHRTIDDTAAMIRPATTRRPSADAYVHHPGPHFAGPGDTERHVEAVRDAVELRAAFLRARLADEPAAVDTAEVDLTGAAPGDRVLVTDVTGWTIAALDVHEVRDGGLLRVTVEPGSVSEVVDRVWRLEHDGGHLDADVTLYVRDHPEVCGMPRCEDWVDPGSAQPEVFDVTERDREPQAPPGDATGDGADDASGDGADDGYDRIAAKDSLEVAEVADGEPGPPLRSWANPYSDKVTARVVLGAVTELVLVRPDGPGGGR